MSEYEELMAKLWGIAEPESPSEPVSVPKDISGPKTYKNLLNELGLDNNNQMIRQDVSIPGYKRMLKTPGIPLQNVAQSILNKYRNQPLYSKFPFMHENVNYIAVLEPHPANAYNPKPHKGISLFEPINKIDPTDYNNRNLNIISGLMPELKQLAIQLINKAKEDGINILLTSGYRSNEEQAKLYQQGRTTKGQVVTNLRAGKSKHNYGAAFDVAFIDNNKIHWNGDWDKLGQIGKSLGLVWGGNFKSFPDKPHFELPYNLQRLSKNSRNNRINILKLF